MRRRAFLQLSAGIAGTGILPRVHARRAGKAEPKVVIVGGGFAGASCALALRRLNLAIEVTIVDPDDRYIACPLSNGVIVGLRDLQSLGVPRSGLERAGVRCVRGLAAGIDARSRRVRLDGGAVLAYDRVVVAPGIRFLWGKPEGYDLAAARLMPHAWQAGPQTELLAAQLRAMRDGGVVAIAVPAGPMRCPPAPFERATLIAGYLKQHKPRSKVLIFDSNNRFPMQEAFADAWHSMYPGLIEWIPVVEGGAVLRVAPEKRIVYTSQGEHRVDIANIIPPQAPALLAAQAGLASDHGWCPVNPRTFESLLMADAHVIGDACIADPMPKAASAANSQAKQCASAIVAALEGREADPPLLESVCYSMLARGRALSVRGRYHLAGRVIEQIPAPDNPVPPDAENEWRNALDWYERIVMDAFAA